MKKRQLGLLLVILLCIAILIVEVFKDDKEELNPEPVENAANINDKLPYTLKVDADDKRPEIIAYRILFDFMKSLEDDGIISNASYTRFTKLSGDENTFVVATVFQVQLPESGPQVDYKWGEIQENRVVPNIVWKLTINKLDQDTYTLANIERSNDIQIGLPPVETLEDYHKKAGIEEDAERNKYQIKDEKLMVTYDNGRNWKTVPVPIDNLIISGYNESNLAEGSYVITPEKTAFVLDSTLRILMSTDKGESWNEVVISEQLPPLRLRILGFTSEQDGYLIVTGDKTMSSEANFIFKTIDGGQSWNNVGSVEHYRLVTDGGFINDQLGFISFGEYREESKPPIPNLYRTTDGGVNWERVEVPIPEEYLGYFTIAEIPTFTGTEGTLLVNQGPNGDYLGGNVLAQFSTQNQGKTWSFSGLVDPDGVLLSK
ncbi:WD40/YVTN/BNR-like repeat-containing protein [Bacillus sinesaloumensis]|uniref:WD40/YVTN/BNR-like repeat-containing protein n=1 Tax=Litchfieldia sinesaloumensis TaxID=1926280 RepID=UPI0009FEE5B5|nr:hypothetical protein [Bacillus sinesaloumensis]